MAENKVTISQAANGFTILSESAHYPSEQLDIAPTLPEALTIAASRLYRRPLNVCVSEVPAADHAET